MEISPDHDQYQLAEPFHNPRMGQLEITEDELYYSGGPFDTPLLLSIKGFLVSHRITCEVSYYGHNGGKVNGIRLDWTSQDGTMYVVTTTVTYSALTVMSDGRAISHPRA